MLVRPYRPHDLPAIAEIEMTSHQCYWTGDELRRLAVATYHRCLVVDNGAPIGYTIVELKANCVSILRLAVSPESRRQGVASSLVNWLVMELAMVNHLWLECRVPERSVAAQLFLKSCGFRYECAFPQKCETRDGREDEYLFRLSV